MKAPALRAPITTDARAGALTLAAPMMLVRAHAPCSLAPIHILALAVAGFVVGSLWRRRVAPSTVAA